MKRFVRLVISWFAWDRKIPPTPPDAVAVALREAHRCKLDGFNQALAAATSLRELLRQDLKNLSIRRASVQACLKEAAAASDEAVGASLALQLQTLGTETAELSLRLEQATRDAVELAALRDEAIQRAQAELQEVSELSAQASLGRALSSDKES